jgi:predicted ATPase/DNA-binding SARP family transcriptional activator
MGAVQFRVLGPLEAARDDGRLGLGGRKPRAVLAALLLSDGRQVRTDALVDALWGDAAPASAVKAVHKHVSFLRRQLGDPRLIVTRPDGYELAATDVDRRRFEELVDEAAAADREPERRAARLAEALALWRGEPYPDLGDLPAAVAERRRLEERRLAAVEALAEARLALGQHHDLVGWLEQLVAAHPLHERLWGQLMVALYRSGRQADALAAYRRLRATLVEQLGVEPAPELRRLQERVLAQHQALEPAGARSGGEPAGGPGNLPRQLTSFVGRDAEVRELAALTAAHRAVTLTGAAGAGKTRLALELAARLRGRHPDGAWLAELAPATPDQVPQAVASAIGLADQPGRTVAEALADYLGGRRLLLVLDNAEHLVDAVAGLVEPLLRAAPGLHVLATSRQPLGVAGEVTCEVAPLPVPPTDAAADVGASDAVRLLAERARAADPSFAVTTAAAASLARICRRLDGLPLALELAAPRLRAFDPRDLADLLDDRFRLLGPATRRAPARHQTLRAAIGWSYDLLTPEEQTLFRRLSVFDGGFTLEAAGQVCAGQPLDRGAVVARLASLVDQSLVAADRHPGGGTRYRMLETLREYARERLAGDEAARLHRRHLRWFLDLASQADRRLQSPRQREWLALLDAERGNLRAALRWSLAGDEAARSQGVRLTILLWRYWDLRALFNEGRAWADAALSASPRLDPPARAELLATTAAIALWGGGHDQAAALARQSLELFRGAGDEAGMARASMLAGYAALHRGDLAAAGELLDHSRAEFARLGRRWDQATALGRLGCLLRERGEHGRSRARFEEALALQREVGDERGVAWTTWQLGVLAYRQAEHPRATRLCQESLALHQRLGAAYGLAHVRNTLGDLAAARGDTGGAVRLYEASLSTLRDLGDRQCTATTLASLAAAALRAGDPERAGALLDESMAVCRDLDDRTGMAGGLELLAAVREAEGDPAAAARHLGTAHALREATGAVRPAAASAAHDTLVQNLQATLGEPAFTTAWSAGLAAPDAPVPDEPQLTSPR